MEASEYQMLSARTLLEKPGFVLSDRSIMLLWNTLGMCGEAGEAADDIKKAIFHQHGIDLQKIEKELGDVLWYIAAICTTLDISLDEVMQLNVKKLWNRYTNGFNPLDGINRGRS